MKKIITIAVAVGLTMAVAAQHGLNRGRIYIGVPAYSYGLGYVPFYYSPFGYYPFGYPYGYRNGYRISSRLQVEVDDIKNDYSDKIKSAKHDTSLSKDERKKIVHQLKMDRDKAVYDAKVNYYKPKKPAPQPEDKG
ncbi:MAG: hypothetical protein ABJB86_07245 [Bacteroidota bacterium]